MWGECDESGEPTYHARIRLADGRPSIVIDPGSVSNLCGDEWAREVATVAAQHGQTPTYEKRQQPLKVSGVGNGTQECHFDCSLPVALRQTDNGQVGGHLTIPAVHRSKLPGLLGLTTLKKNRAILDLNTLKLYFCGPGHYDLCGQLPKGTESFQLEAAPSGHLVLPCSEFQTGNTDSEYTLTLMSRIETEMTSRVERSSTIPPPPSYPPVLPDSAMRRADKVMPPAPQE